MKESLPASGPARDARPDDRVELTIPSSPKHLSLVRLMARWLAEKARLPEKDWGRVELAAVEATTNIIRHAYGGDATKVIRITLREIEDGIEIEFLDDGKGAPPGALVGRDPSELEPGGLGIRMMKTCMDGFHYEPLPGCGSRLVLRKLRRDDATAAGSNCMEEAP
jgi:anti-sigma regulatory factor (Ser/Thr protein kinase)